MENISFKYWLEAVQDYRQQIQKAVITKIRELLGLKGPEQDVLDQNLKNLSKRALMDVIREGNRRNFADDRLRDILRGITSKNTAEFTVSQLIDKLDENIDRTVANDSKKTYPPKTPSPTQNSSNVPPLQTPTLASPPPMSMQPSPNMTIPPQNV